MPVDMLGGLSSGFALGVSSHGCDIQEHVVLVAFIHQGKARRHGEVELNLVLSRFSARAISRPANRHRNACEVERRDQSQTHVFPKVTRGVSFGQKEAVAKPRMNSFLS